MITRLGEKGAGCFAFHWLTCNVHRSLFTIPLGLISRQCSVTVALHGYSIHYLLNLL